jgi:hypothetical protein
MDQREEAAKRFSEFLERQPDNFVRALIAEIGPDRMTRFFREVERFFLPLAEQVKQVDLGAMWDGRWTRRNIIRAAEEALEDDAMPAARAESIRELRALFIEGFDRFAHDKTPSPATRAAAATAKSPTPRRRASTRIGPACVVCNCMAAADASPSSTSTGSGRES